MKYTNYVKIEIKEENYTPFGNWRNVLPYNFSSRNKTKQTNKQTSKQQSDLLTLTVSCEESSCLIRSKKEKKKQNRK